MKISIKKCINKRLLLVFGIIFSFFSVMSIAESVTNGNVEINPIVQKELQDTLYLELDTGCKISISMLPKKAPKHVARIKELVKERYFDGIEFHRVIEGFMAQAGGRNGNPNASSGVKIKAEFNDVKHVRGAVSMARASDPDSADAQFFIVTKDSQFLDKQYTAWGIVMEGMDCVDSIKKGLDYENGAVKNPTKIKSMRIAYDVEVEKAKAKK